MDRDHSSVVLDLLGKAVCQASESAHPHPHCQIVPFNVARAYMLGVGITADNLHVSADALADCSGASRHRSVRRISSA